MKAGETIGFAVEPGVLAARIAAEFSGRTPTRAEISETRKAVLRRQKVCKLEPKAAPECVMESFYRCLITDWLQRRYPLPDGAPSLPFYLNSSHTAARGVCIATHRHNHLLPDKEWSQGWKAMQRCWGSCVNIPVAGRKNPKRADLYAVADGQIISIEFKYVGPKGTVDIEGCCAQVRRYLAAHAASVLVVYIAQPGVDRVGLEKSLRKSLLRI